MITDSRNALLTAIATIIVITIFVQVTPKISATEAAALEAGTIGFDRDIFDGTASLQSLKDKYPIAKLSDREQSFLDNEVRATTAVHAWFCSRVMSYTHAILFTYSSVVRVVGQKPREKLALDRLISLCDVDDTVASFGVAVRSNSSGGESGVLVRVPG